MAKPTLAQQIVGTTHRGDYGVGSDLQQITPPVQKVWNDFSKGFAAVDSPEDTPEGASFDAVDMEVDRRDRLVRAPGVALVEALTHTPSDMILHGNLDSYSELVMFSAPWVGYKAASTTIWSNEGIELNRQMAGTLYADILILTDGRKLYSRRPSTNALTVEAGPPGEDVAVFGSRVLVGGGLFGGNIELLSVQWNDADGDYKNWGGLGSGVEFLLSGGPESDRIVAMRTMNLSLLAILNRHAIWVGSLTGNGLAPFSFTVRLKGVGCAARRTAHSTEFGVLFLSDDGVRAFDGNTAPVISDAINSELLPLVGDGAEYRASYDATGHRYYLFVPGGPTYVLDLNKQRWYKWSRTYNGGVTFPVQVAQTRWADLVGTWAAQTQRWVDMIVREGESRHLLLSGANLGIESTGVETSFDVPFNPHWSMPIAQPEDQTRMFRTDRVEIRSQGAGTVRFNLPGNTGEYETGEQIVIAGSSLDTFYDTHIKTGLGLGLQVEVLAGSPKISRAAVHGRFQGLRQ